MQIRTFCLTTFVWNISNFEKESLIISGAFTPLTMNGNIIVDGVLASCYTSVNHNSAHIGMTPLRWFPGLNNLILSEETISSSYINIAKVIGKWVNLYDAMGNS